jgi:hypothetical protein
MRRGWYAPVAANGYSSWGDPADQQSVASFPAMAAMLSLIPRGEVYRLWFGTFLSIAFFAEEVTYSFQLPRSAIGDEAATAAVALLAA